MAVDTVRELLDALISQTNSILGGGQGGGYDRGGQGGGYGGGGQGGYGGGQGGYGGGQSGGGGEFPS